MIFVGVSLLAIAFGQAINFSTFNRYREQARSYKTQWLLRDLLKVLG